MFPPCPQKNKEEKKTKTKACHQNPVDKCGGILSHQVHRQLGQKQIPGMPAEIKN